MLWPYMEEIMNYRKSRGLHILNIGRLCLMWRVRKRRRPSPTWADRHHKQLPRAKWPVNRSAHYGEGAVEASLFPYAEPQRVLVKPSMPKTHPILARDI